MPAAAAAGTASASATDPQMDLSAVIDQLKEPQLRDVLQYLILLNPGPVQNAIHYVQRSSGTSIAAPEVQVEEEKTDPSHHGVLKEKPPANTTIANVSTKAVSIPPIDTSIPVDPDAHTPTESQQQHPSSQQINTLAPPAPPTTPSLAEFEQHTFRRSNIDQDVVDVPPLSASRRKTIDEDDDGTVPMINPASPRRKVVKSNTKTLLILCSSEPATKQQATNQVSTMALCKAQKGALNEIIVYGDMNLEKCKELFAISRIEHYPQFFVQLCGRESSQDQFDFIGDFKTISTLNDQGLLNPEYIFSNASPHTQNTQTSDARPGGPDITNSASLLDAPSAAATTTPNHLKRMNQPKTTHDDEKSLDDDDVFDDEEDVPQASPKSKTPMLDAARKAKKAMDEAANKMDEDVGSKRPNEVEHAPMRHVYEDDDDDDDDGIVVGSQTVVPDHLLPISQPNRLRSYTDEKSLDEMEIFDPVDTSPKSKTPILDAAKKAKEAMTASASATATIPPVHMSHQNGHSQPPSEVPDYLITLNQPQQVSDDDDMKSLDDDEIFDEPDSPPSKTPVLDAAMEAKQQKDGKASVDTSTRGVAQADPKMIHPGEKSNHALLRHTMAGLKSAKNRHLAPEPPSPMKTLVQLKSTPPPPSKRASLTASPMSPREQIKLKSLSPQLQSRSTLTPPTAKIDTSLAVPDIKATSSRPAAPSTSESELSALKPPAVAGSSTTAKEFESNSQPSPTPTPEFVQDAATAPVTDTSSALHQAAQKTDGNEKRKSAFEKFPDGGACYLVYHPVEGELNIHYSEIPIDGAVGVWTTPDIHAFKTAQNLSRSELIGNCAMGVTQERKNYYNGWCQFVKAARSMDATVTVLDVGLPIDFYLYIAGMCVKAAPKFETAMVDGVACLPRNIEFYGNGSLDGKKFKKKAKKTGALAEFAILSEIKAAEPLDGIAATESENAAPQSQSQHQARSQSQQRQTHAERMQDEEAGDDNLTSVFSSETVDDEDDDVDERGRFIPKRAVMPDFAPVPPSPAKEPVAQSVPVPGQALSSETTPIPDTGACYLVYEPDSSGRLVLHYSKKPLKHAIGMFLPGSNKKISGFKFKENLGKSVLIGNCSAGVQGRKNYCSGWCQFVRGARILNGQVTLWDPTEKGLMVDVWLYNNDNRPSHQSFQMVEGMPMDITKILAVACLPKNTPFYAGITVDIVKWIGDADAIGAASRF